MNEEVIYVTDTLGVSSQEFIEKQSMSLSELFAQGGAGYMIVITLFLIGLLIAAWKAPRWIKEIGIGALTVSVFFSMMGLYQIWGICQTVDVAFGVICGGLKCTMITAFYGLIVYFISLIIRVIQKPRI